MTITTQCVPPIPMTYNRDLLSTPIPRSDADRIHELSAMLLKRIESDEFKRFPSTLKKLQQQHQQFMELYERAKTEERKVKEKAFVKTYAPFYRPRLNNKNDQRLFERLEDRRRMSVAAAGRKNREV
jgi:hypothetical protein